MNLTPMKALAFFLVTTYSFAQENDAGIYLELVGKSCMGKKVRLYNTRTFVCISNKHVIGLNDFKEISALEEGELKQDRKFTISLSEEGRDKLTAISRIYSGKNLAFVMDDLVVCLMKVNGVVTSGKLVVAEDLHNSSLKQVHRKIKEAIER